MSLPEISVIVPIYNVEKYLSDCLDSILSQTFQDFEVICVNDGSTDNCYQIIDKYALQDKRISVIHQENKGVSRARNVGIEQATGKYITFCDSDDYWHRDFLKIMHELITKYDVDMVSSDIVPTKNRYSKNLSDLSNFKPKLKLIDNPFDYFLKTNKIRTGVPFKLYRAEPVKQMRFVEGIYLEDVPFTTFLLEKMNKVLLTNWPLYYYYTNPDSVMRSSFTASRIKGYVRLMYHLAQETEKTVPGYTEIIRKNVTNKRFKMMLNQSIRKQKNINERKLLFVEIQQYVEQMFQDKVISYAGLKPHHQLALFLLLHGKSEWARHVMTIL